MKDIEEEGISVDLPANSLNKAREIRSKKDMERELWDRRENLIDRLDRLECYGSDNFKLFEEKAMKGWLK